MSKHTRGPWEADAVGNDGDIGIYQREKITAFSKTIAICFGAQPEGAHNAQLIAAAPEMLETLEECLSILEMGEKVTSTRIRYAIGKAKGGKHEGLSLR